MVPYITCLQYGSVLQWLLTMLVITYKKHVYTFEIDLLFKNDRSFLPMHAAHWHYGKHRFQASQSPLSHPVMHIGAEGPVTG